VAAESVKRTLPAHIVVAVMIVAACAPAAPGPTSTLPQITASPVVTATPASTATATPPPPMPSPSRSYPPLLTASSAPATAAPEGSVALELKIDLATACPPAPGCPIYSPTEISASSGTIVFYLANTSDADHNFLFGPEIGFAIAASPKVYGRHAITFVVEAVPAGSYTFWCTIDNGYGPHWERGMVGTLTVS
jgi:plastocyanin